MNDIPTLRERLLEEVSDRATNEQVEFIWGITEYIQETIDSMTDDEVKVYMNQD